MVAGCTCGWWWRAVLIYGSGFVIVLCLCLCLCMVVGFYFVFFFYIDGFFLNMFIYYFNV